MYVHSQSIETKSVAMYLIVGYSQLAMNPMSKHSMTRGVWINWKLLEIGDSIYFPETPRASLLNLTQRARRYGHRYTSHRHWDGIWIRRVA